MGRNEGYSPHLPVREHSIVFGLNVALEHELGVDRITSELEDAPLRIHVNQETEGGKEFVLFGVLCINLAEFAGARETTRRFLLSQSRTNASLSITVYSTLKGGGAPYYKVPEPSMRFVSLEDEGEEEGTEGFRTHKASNLLISDQRYMVRQREFMQVPPHVVATRIPASEVIDDLLSGYDK